MGLNNVADLHNIAEADMIIKGGKSLPIGTKRTHGGVEVEKTSKGWVPVKKDKKGGAEFSINERKVGSSTYYQVVDKAGNVQEEKRTRAAAEKFGRSMTASNTKATKAATKKSDTYFNTLSGALDQVRAEAKKHGFTVDEDDMFTQFGTGGISYGSTKSATIPLMKDGKAATSKSGGKINRNIRVSIYRMDSGKYELTAYKTW